MASIRPIWTFLFIFSMLAFSASALDEYTQIGGPDGTFSLGTGQFNEQLETDIAFTKTLTSPKFTPLVADLDVDGTNEIIVLDAGTIRVYRGKELDIVDSFSIGGSIWSPPIVFNIRQDTPATEQFVTVNIAPSKDTYLDQVSPNTIHGTEAIVNLDRTTAGEMRVISKFDISSIPSNAVITEALLIMNTTLEAGGTWTGEIRNMASDWTEGGATWNTYNGVNSWSSAGGDVTPSVYATFAAPDGVAPIITTVNATLLAQEWKSSGVNFGVMMKAQAVGGSTLKTMHSREAGAALPALRVSYVVPPSAVADKPEIIIATGTDIKILRYNGTSLSNLSGIPNGITGVNHKEVLVGCRDVESCLLYHSSSTNEGTPPVTDSIQVVSFNSSSLSGNTATIVSSLTRQPCLPQIPVMQVADVDNDGDEEYVFSTLAIASSGNEDINIYYISQNTTGVKGASLMRTVTAASVSLVTVSKDSVNCDVSTNYPANQFPPSKFLSSPLVGDIDGSVGTGMETVIAHAIDDDEFVMRSFEGTGSAELDRYPEILNADGRIISNVAFLKSFPDHAGEDFCVLGFKQDANRLDLLCASEQTGATPQTEEFIFSSSNFTNITAGYQSHASIIHGVQDSTTTTDGTNLQELLHYYGVSKLVYDTSFFPPDNTLTLIWGVPEVGALIQVDAEMSGLDDIISLTPTNIWYFDDAFTNSQAAITAYTVNPCLDSVWEQGTTVNVQVDVDDPENDLVSSRVILYNDEGAEDDSGWSAFTSESATFSFGFTANTTTPISTLRIMARDEQHLSEAEADVIDVTFSVATSGVSFGDCISNVDIDTETGGDADDGLDEFNVTTLDPQDNVVINPVRIIAGWTKLGVLATFLLILLGLNIYIALDHKKLLGHGDNMKFVLIIIGVIDFIAFVIGTLIGIIPIGLIILFAILGLLILAFAFKDKLGGGFGSG